MKLLVVIIFCISLRIQALRQLADSEKILQDKNLPHKIPFARRILLNSIKIPINDSARIETLNIFLAANIYHNIDKINWMLLPDLRYSITNPLSVIKYDPRKEAIKNNHTLKNIGSQSCSLEKLAVITPKLPVPVCPWHWKLVEREDKYPFKRANAICNCENCQANTIFDSVNFKLSSCQNENVLLPALLRESNNGESENWSFHLEEVPVACVCSIRLNPYS